MNTKIKNKKYTNKNLPKFLHLKWHKGYKKDYPKNGACYLVMLQERNNNEFYPDFAIFVKETLGGKNYVKFVLLCNKFIIGEIFISFGSNKNIFVENWAEIGGEKFPNVR